ncbi:MAG: sugar phosphate isomerase/epimerase, partial [Verrucomicrobiota bacterium]
MINRRSIIQLSCAASASAAFMQAADEQKFAYKYIVGSSMYGDLKLADILQEIPKTGAEFIDVWPKRHGTQREQ